MLRRLPLLFAALLAAAPLAALPTTARVSEFNRHSSYLTAVYDGWVRSSRYVTVQDGPGWRWTSSACPSRSGQVAMERRGGPRTWSCR
jgi:hypothetical protein